MRVREFMSATYSLLYLNIAFSSIRVRVYVYIYVHVYVVASARVRIFTPI